MVLVYTTRPMGRLSTSFGPQMSPLQRRLIAVRLNRVAEEMTPITNHAWGILFRFLVHSGDLVVAASSLNNATPLNVEQSMLNVGLDNWHTFDGGVYAVNAPFVDLLNFGYHVAASEFILFTNILDRNYGRFATQLGANVSYQYQQYRADSNQTPQQLNLIPHNLYAQQFRITAKQMATSLLVYYMKNLANILFKCVDFLVSSLLGLQDADMDRLSRSLLY
jgi:hypothetical protein